MNIYLDTYLNEKMFDRLININEMKKKCTEYKQS